MKSGKKFSSLWDELRWALTIWDYLEENMSGWSELGRLYFDIISEMEEADGTQTVKTIAENAENASWITELERRMDGN